MNTFCRMSLLTSFVVTVVLGTATTMAQAQAPGSGAATSFPKIEDAVDPKKDTEPARINSINFYGNARVPTSALKQNLGISVGEVMKPDLMGKAMDAIVAAYKARGFDVQVRPRVSHPKQNFVDVNFLIDETKGGGHD